MKYIKVLIHREKRKMFFREEIELNKQLKKAYSVTKKKTCSSIKTFGIKPLTDEQIDRIGSKKKSH